MKIPICLNSSTEFNVCKYYYPVSNIEYWKETEEPDWSRFKIYSWLSLSRPRLSRITAYLEVESLVPA